MEYKKMLTSYGLTPEQLSAPGQSLIRSLDNIIADIEEKKKAAKEKKEEYIVTEQETASMEQHDKEIQAKILEKAEFMKPDQYKHFIATGEKPEKEVVKEQKEEVKEEIRTKGSSWNPLEWISGR